MNKIGYFILAIPLYLVINVLIFSLVDYLFVFSNQLFLIMTVIFVFIMNMLITRLVLEHILPPIRE